MNKVHTIADDQLARDWLLGNCTRDKLGSVSTVDLMMFHFSQIILVAIFFPPNLCQTPLSENLVHFCSQMDTPTRLTERINDY